MADALTGYTFTDGVPNDCSGPNLNSAVNGLTILPDFITVKPAGTPVATDSVVFYQAAQLRLAKCALSAILALPGTVKSVGLSVASVADLLAVAGSPVTGTSGGTGTGTLILSKPTATANKVYAAPDGATGVPTMRLLQPRDVAMGSVALTPGATVPIDASVAEYFTLTTGQNCTLGVPSSFNTGQKFNLAIGNAGAFTVTWFAGITWMATGAVPVPFTGTSYYRFTKGPATILGEVLRNV